MCKEVIEFALTFYLIIVATFLLPIRIVKVRENAYLRHSLKVNTLEILMNAREDGRHNSGWCPQWEIEKSLKHYKGFANFPDNTIMRLGNYGTRELSQLLKAWNKQGLLSIREKQYTPDFKLPQFQITQHGVEVCEQIIRKKRWKRVVVA